jgi:hypothetical protein
VKRNEKALGRISLPSPLPSASIIVLSLVGGVGFDPRGDAIARKNISFDFT